MVLVANAHLGVQMRWENLNERQREEARHIAFPRMDIVCVFWFDKYEFEVNENGVVIEVNLIEEWSSATWNKIFVALVVIAAVLGWFTASLELF